MLPHSCYPRGFHVDATGVGAPTCGQVRWGLAPSLPPYPAPTPTPMCPTLSDTDSVLTGQEQKREDPLGWPQGLGVKGHNSIEPKSNCVQDTDRWPQRPNCTADKLTSEDGDRTGSNPAGAGPTEPAASSNSLDTEERGRHQKVPRSKDSLRELMGGGLLVPESARDPFSSVHRYGS